MSRILQRGDLLPVFRALPQARLVGGCVRDTLAGLPITDIDMATPDPPEAVRRALRRQGIRTIDTGLAHGTLTALSRGTSIEITTLRRDEATDGRHARVAWTDDWEEDAARRDFTINAMSLDQAGTLHDYFGGRKDLAEGRVRFVGEAALRIEEDRLRMLRFFRFFARYGRGAPDPDALQAIAGQADKLTLLAAERIWSELKRILAAPDPAISVRLMAGTGALAAILPEGTDPERFAALVAGGLPPDPLLRLGALLAAEAAFAAERLRLSNKEARRLIAMQGGPLPAPEPGGAAWRRLAAEETQAALIDRTWLAGGFGPAWDTLRAWIAETPPPIFPLAGRDLVALGLPPGPALGAILAQVRGWWLEGGCTADGAQCLDHARGLAAAILS